MKLGIVHVPYDSGHRERRTGRGPGAMVEVGLIPRLRERGHEVSFTEVDATLDVPSDSSAALALQPQIAEAVHRNITAGRLPVILSGSCHLAALGAVGGLDFHGMAGDRLGVAWLDAHGDLNTPETSSSGFFDGMSLAMLTGRCWRPLMDRFEGVAPIDDEQVALVGARDLDPEEEILLQNSAMAHVRPGELALLSTIWEHWRAVDRRLYLHVDLDVVDPSVLLANPWAVPGGLTADALSHVVQVAVAHLPVATLAFTAFDPSYGDAEKAATLVVDTIDAVAPASG